MIRPLHDRFVQAVEAFARQHDVPLVPFESDQRKDDVVATYRAESDTAVPHGPSKLQGSRLLMVSLTDDLVEVHQPHACR